MVTALKVSKDSQFRAPMVHTLIVSNKSPSVIAKVKCFMVEDFQEFMQATGQKFSIKVFLKVHKVYGVILSTISRNFSEVHRDPNIKLLEPNDFKMLLKHKRLGVTAEDEVVIAFSLWLQS